jgi:hypothetical protein
MQRRMAMAAFLTLALGAFGCEKATDNVELFQTTMAGSNEVPPNASGASGACGLQIDGQRVLYSLEVHGLSNIIGAHIHVAPTGTNGPIRAVFLPFPGSASVLLTTPIASADGVLTSGSFGPSDVAVISYDQLLTEIRNGNTYCNVHTNSFRGGEIRGQFAKVSSN